jgi:hypothetical protein
LASQGQNPQKESKKAPEISKEPLYSSYSYFIKNATGEILMFKTLSAKAFQEVQPDEEIPIDF